MEPKPMTTNSNDEVVEIMVPHDKECAHNIKEAGKLNLAPPDGCMCYPRTKGKRDWLRSKLTTLISQARREGYNEGYGKCDAENEFEYKRGIRKALELVEKNDPNVEMGRKTNPHYWGNCLRRELQEALTTEGK